MRATVTALSDTGQLIHYDPAANLTVTLEDGQVVSMQTLVPKIQIPRIGDAAAQILARLGRRIQRTSHPGH